MKTSIRNLLKNCFILLTGALIVQFSLVAECSYKKHKKFPTKNKQALTELGPQFSADEILKRADQIRNPDKSFLMRVQVSNSGAQTDTSLFEVSIDSEIEGGQKVFRTLIKTLLPKRDNNRKMLMVDEEMWAYIPNLKRAVRISLSQKLTGQAANGDICRMRLSGDYLPQIESEKENEWVLILKAQKKGLTYEQVRLWVEKNTFKPLKAEFLTNTGMVLKKATYQNFIPMAGQLRPSEVLIQDAVTETDQSLITIKKMEIKNFPKTAFDSDVFGQNE